MVFDKIWNSLQTQSQSEVSKAQKLIYPNW